MSASNNTSKAKATKLERQRQALELRRMGFGYVEIGEKVGCSKSQAHRLVKEALAETITLIGTQADELKAEEISRLDAMLRGVWPDARKGNHGAIDRALKIMERRAKLLGLDAPTKIAPTTPDGQQSYERMSEVELDARIAELAGKLGAAGAALGGDHTG